MKNRAALFFTFVFMITLACNFGGSSPATVDVSVPSTETPFTISTDTPTSTLAPIGISISANGTSFVIPQGVASGAAFEAIPVSLPQEDAPYWEIYPAHIKFSMDGYVLQGKFHDPRIIVYPAPEYSKVHEGAAGIIAELQALIANPSTPLAGNLPFMPIFNAGQVFHSNEQFLKFQNGTGIRFLTQFAQAPFPANNQDLFYTFQGLTNDGAYYVAVILPVNVGFLSSDGNPDTPLPAGGIPFDWDNFENTQAHFDLVVQKLNSTDPNEFLPSLSILDTMMQSIFAGIQQ